VIPGVEGAGQTVEFTAAGYVICSQGSLVNGRYVVEDDNLVQTSAEPPETVTVRFAVRGDTMTQYAIGRPDSVTLLRRPSDSAMTGVAGRWYGRGPNGGESVIQYRADGTFRLWVPLEFDSSQFNVLGDSITIMGGNLLGRYHWSESAGRLRLVPVSNVPRAPLTMVRVKS
jgi:hypothetical protein